MRAGESGHLDTRVAAVCGVVKVAFSCRLDAGFAAKIVIGKTPVLG